MVKKSILIIGSSGFFGQSILDFVSKNKKIKKKINEIILFSRSKKNRISKEAKKNFKILQMHGNISKIKKLPYADYVIYCAISKNLNNELNAVKNYIKLAQKYHKKSSILYTSSGAVYGNQIITTKKFSENHKPKPNNHKSLERKKYAIIKYKSEKLFKTLVKKNIKISIARCFAFVGKNIPLEKNYVIGNLINNILDNRKLRIKSNKKVFRSYMYSDDLANSLICLLFDKKINFKIFNLGSDDKIDIRQLAVRLSKKFKLKLDMKKLSNNKINEYDYYIPDISKFKKRYKYKQKLNSFNSIIKTLKEFKNYE